MLLKHRAREAGAVQEAGIASVGMTGVTAWRVYSRKSPCGGWIQGRELHGGTISAVLRELEWRLDEDVVGTREIVQKFRDIGRILVFGSDVAAKHLGASGRFSLLQHLEVGLGPPQANIHCTEIMVRSSPLCIKTLSILSLLRLFVQRQRRRGHR